MRQMEFKNWLATHNMSALVAAAQTPQGAHASTYQIILNLAPKVQVSHLGGFHKVDLLLRKTGLWSR